MPRSTRSRLAVAPAALAVGLAPALLVASPANADDYSAMDQAELQLAITAANANPGVDRIVIGDNITLNAALPAIHEDVEVLGNGHTLISEGWPVFDASGASLTIDSITIDDASHAIRVTNGSLIATDVTVTDANAIGVLVTDSDVDVDGITVTGGHVDNMSVQNHAVPATHTVTIRNGSFNGSGDGDGLVVEQYSAGTVVLDDLTADDNHDYGYEISIGGTTVGTFTDVSAHRSGDYGVSVGVLDDGSVELDNVDGDESNGGGRVTVLENGSFVSHGSGPTGNTGPGWAVDAVGPNTTTTFEDVLTSLNTSGMSFSVRDGATITATRGRTQGGGVGLDFGPATPLDPPGDGTVTVTGFDIINAGDHGVRVRAGIGSTDINLVESTIFGVDSGLSDGAAIQAVLESGTLTVERSTLYNNTSLEPGGGVWVNGDGTGGFALVNSTLTGNTSESSGSAIHASNLATLDIRSSTIVDNPTPNSSVYLENVATATVRNTVIDGGDEALVVDEATALHVDWSLIGSGNADVVALVAAGEGNLPLGTDPMVGALGENGGPTPTMLPQLGSPLLDAGDPAFAAPPATDQRGENRVSDGRVDIGAVEVQVSDPAGLPATGATTGWLLPVALILLGLGLVAVVIVVIRRARRS